MVRSSRSAPIALSAVAQMLGAPGTPRVNTAVNQMANDWFATQHNAQLGRVENLEHVRIVQACAAAEFCAWTLMGKSTLGLQAHLTGLWFEGDCVAHLARSERLVAPNGCYMLHYQLLE